jgi:arylsulfatase A-like enzyme
VPSILSWPGKLTPQRSAALSSTLDVMPTVLGWAGIEYPGDFDGIDLGPVIEAPETTSNRQLFWGGDGFFWQGSAVREGRYKLLIDQSPGADGVPQLFDLSQDIGEQNNIAAENAVRVDRLFNALQRWKKAVGVAVPAR